MGVVLASEGYPESYEKGATISGFDAVEQNQTVKLFHAGTERRGQDAVATGGRVLCSTALGKTLRDAQTAAYKLASSVSWNGSWYRRDIGFKAL